MWESRWIKYTWDRGDEEEVQEREWVWKEEGGDITKTHGWGSQMGRGCMI